MSHPLRIQRRRTKGYRLPEGAICVTRPGKWGNPYGTAAEFRSVLTQIVENKGYTDIPGWPEDFNAMLEIAHDIGELRGKTLACWCDLGADCHADVLCELANGEL